MIRKCSSCKRNCRRSHIECQPQNDFCRFETLTGPPLQYLLNCKVFFVLVYKTKQFQMSLTSSVLRRVRQLWQFCKAIYIAQELRLSRIKFGADIYTALELSATLCSSVRAWTLQDFTDNRLCSLNLTPSTPAGPNCCRSNGSAPYWCNPPL